MTNTNDVTAHFNGAFPVVVDLSMSAANEVQKLKNLGVKVIIRYYALKPQPDLPEKIIHKAEADAILNSGLSLAISYQYFNGNIETFTPERAKADVASCVKRADEIGQPKGSAIYFGVDAGWDSESDIKKVLDYFSTLNKEVHEKNQDRFSIGIYGSGLMCERMRTAGYAKFFWIAGLSDGWPGRTHFVKGSKWNLYQNVLEFPVGSVKVDTDVVNPNAAAIGSFHRPSPGSPAVMDGPIDNQVVLNVQRFVKGNGHVLLDKPGGTVLRKLAASKMVTKIKDVDDLAVIDVPRQISTGHGNEQIADFVRGYCPKDVLVGIDQDPT
jgi:hypothetical protein